ncbi:mediator of rna polymerase ii transcription subunit 5 [Gossypium arboreum]|uniref:Mediator of rna polymerase ii transcription subunit 5 n=1 Tax=Gossypium arboreum TaxID=29729 RepID=A0A0B0P819_GOSAR|nr:mediator of rna polymerase ii transcription subunit 5 [Gossypium arboreum]
MLFKFGNLFNSNFLNLGRWNLINASLPFSSTSDVAAPNISTNSAQLHTDISSRFWRFGSNQCGSNVLILEHLCT